MIIIGDWDLYILKGYLDPSKFSNATTLANLKIIDTP